MTQLLDRLKAARSKAAEFMDRQDDPEARKALLQFAMDFDDAIKLIEAGNASQYHPTHNMLYPKDGLPFCKSCGFDSQISLAGQCVSAVFGVWRPIEEFTPAFLAAQPMVLIKRIWENYESYPRVAGFKQKPDGFTAPDDGLAGHWFLENGKCSAFQHEDLARGWATHVILLAQPEGWEHSRGQHGYIKKEKGK